MSQEKRTTKKQVEALAKKLAPEQIGLKRLLELAEHLFRGKLGHEKFDFSQYNNGGSQCGTLGCALGEAPILWKEDWLFRDNGFPSLRTDFHSTFSSSENWFQIGSTEDIFTLEHDLLFLPSNRGSYTKNSIMAQRGMVHLDSLASRYDVAENIIRFVKYKINVLNASNTDASKHTTDTGNV